MLLVLFVPSCAILCRLSRHEGSIEDPNSSAAGRIRLVFIAEATGNELGAVNLFQYGHESNLYFETFRDGTDTVYRKMMFCYLDIKTRIS